MKSTTLPFQRYTSFTDEVVNQVKTKEGEFPLSSTDDRFNELHHSAYATFSVVRLMYLLVCAFKLAPKHEEGIDGWLDLVVHLTMKQLGGEIVTRLAVCFSNSGLYVQVFAVNSLDPEAHERLVMEQHLATLTELTNGGVPKTQMDFYGGLLEVLKHSGRARELLIRDSDDIINLDPNTQFAFCYPRHLGNGTTFGLINDLLSNFNDFGSSFRIELATEIRVLVSEPYRDSVLGNSY